MSIREELSDRDTQHYRDRVIALLGDPQYQPLKLPRLLQRLAPPESARRPLRELLHRMLADGDIVELKHKGLALARDADLLVGRIQVVRSGAAFVREQAGEREVFVPQAARGVALHGDKVIVRLAPRRERGQPGGLPEGAVIRVLERRCKTVVGTLKRQRHVLCVAPMRATIDYDIIVPDARGAALGDRVLVRLDEWDDPRVNPEGEIIETLGPADDPALDTLAVIRSFELNDEFPRDVVREAESAALDAAALAGRKDLRELFIFTIDPATAKDFDDALSLERVRGKWRLGVHIADVSAFVPTGSALDREAYERGTSVYLPDKVIPMLPEQLSNGLCSLNPDVDRLTFSVFVTLTDEGVIERSTFAPSVIHSRLRLTYEQALAALEAPAGKALPEYGIDKRAAALLQNLGTLAQRLRARRFAEGALRMDIPDVRLQIGSDGRIESVQPVLHDRSHQLVEECMLLANECVCRKLAEHQVAQLHRIHEEPDPEKLEELRGTFYRAGFDHGQLTDRHNLNRLLAAIEKLPQAQAWYTAVLRSFKRAMYSTEQRGHYGLGKEFYAHFTSPIRRYPDLVTHRLLKGLLADQQPAYGKRRLTEMAAHCSEREEVAAEVEREIIDLKRLRYFAEQLDRGEPEEYEAAITDVRNFGVFVFLPAVQAMGMIHVSQLSDDFYDFNPERVELRGRRGGRRFAVGDTLKVIVARVDMGRRMLDFAPSAPAAVRPPAKRGAGPSPARGAAAKARAAGAAATPAPRGRREKTKNPRRR